MKSTCIAAFGLVNDECGSWYGRIGEFLMLVWDRRKKVLYGSGLVQVVGWPNPLQSVRPMAFIALAVERECIIVLIKMIFGRSFCISGLGILRLRF